MKKVLALCTAFLFVSLFAVAQDSDVTFEEETHSFGQIPQGVPVTHQFEFTNTGDEPLIVENVKKSCGCTVTDWSKEPIMPGESGFVSAKFNAASMGNFRKPITVNYRVGDKTFTKRLFFEGEVIKKEEHSGIPAKKDNITNQKQ